MPQLKQINNLKVETHADAGGDIAPLNWLDQLNLELQAGLFRGVTALSSPSEAQ